VKSGKEAVFATKSQRAMSICEFVCQFSVSIFFLFLLFYFKKSLLFTVNTINLFYTTNLLKAS